jgi:hypothetical protein
VFIYEKTRSVCINEISINIWSPTPASISHAPSRYCRADAGLRPLPNDFHFCTGCRFFLLAAAAAHMAAAAAADFLAAAAAVATASLCAQVAAVDSDTAALLPLQLQ